MIVAISYIGNACFIIAMHCFLVREVSSGNIGWTMVFTTFCVLSWVFIAAWLFSMKGGG